MTAALVFRIGGAALMLFLAYVLWSGVGQRRPWIARSFAVVILSLAAWLVWPLLALAG